jgi:DNA ligase-1
MPSLPLSLSRRRWLTAVAAPMLSTPAWSRSDTRTAAATELPAPLLASVYTGQVDPALCLVSEKFDGVRAVWDGRVLRHRSGRPVSVPKSFVDALPGEPLDGELWLGRGRFEEVSAIVRREEARDAEWARIHYMVFEMPDPVAGGTFAERAARIVDIAARAAPSPIVAVEQSRVADRAALQQRLDATIAAGGEGLMLHLARAPVAHGRNDVLMKLKPHLDAEAVVVGYRRGAGKYGELVGALEVQAPDGRRFFVGSGLSDALRRAPPSLGESITYRYRDLTSTGLPRFATFLRRDASL